MISNCNLNWVDIRNHKSFFTHPSIEKFVINHILPGEMVFYNSKGVGGIVLTSPVPLSGLELLVMEINMQKIKNIT